MRNFSISKLLKLILLFFTLNTSISLKTIIVKGKDFCIYKALEKGDILTGSFVISGEKQDSVRVTLKGPDSLLYYENKKEEFYRATGDFLIDSEAAGVIGRYFLCFSTIYNLNTVISFEFLTRKESGHLISVAKDEAIDDIYRHVTDVSYLFEEIDKNIKFFVERKETHTTIMNYAINTVRKVNAYKIVIIILLSFLQIFIIKKLFRKSWSDFSENKISGVEIMGI